MRHAISKTSTWITVPLQKTGIRVRDPLSGFFMLHRSCVAGVRLQPEGFKLLLEMVRGNIWSLGRLSRSAISRSVRSA